MRAVGITCATAPSSRPSAERATTVNRWHQRSPARRCQEQNQHRGNRQKCQKIKLGSPQSPWSRAVSWQKETTFLLLNDAHRDKRCLCRVAGSQFINALLWLRPGERSQLMHALPRVHRLSTRHVAAPEMVWLTRRLDGGGT